MRGFWVRGAQQHAAYFEQRAAPKIGYEYTQRPEGEAKFVWKVRNLWTLHFPHSAKVWHNE